MALLFLAPSDSEILPENVERDLLAMLDNYPQISEKPRYDLNSEIDLW